MGAGGGNREGIVAAPTCGAVPSQLPLRGVVPLHHAGLHRVAHAGVRWGAPFRVARWHRAPGRDAASWLVREAAGLRCRAYHYWCWASNTTQSSPPDHHHPPPQAITPVEYEGVKAVSFGFAGQGSAIMRGPMVSDWAAAPSWVGGSMAIEWAAG